jgi:hypothetical protein
LLEPQADISHELIRLTRWWEMDPFASIGEHPRSRLAA